MAKTISSCSHYAPTVLRIFLGLLFLVPGVMKLTNIAGPTGMLTGLGFPAPAFFAWVLALVEVIGGIMLIVGYLTRWAVWPLVVVMVIATVMVVIPNMTNPSGLLFHLLAIAGLVSVFLSGSGALAVDKN